MTFVGFSRYITQNKRYCSRCAKWFTEEIWSSFKNLPQCGECGTRLRSRPNSESRQIHNALRVYI